MALQTDYQVVSLEWVDAGSIIGWTATEEAHGLVKVRSIAILFSEDDEKVVLTTSINEHKQATDPISIPKAWIKDRKEIGTLTL